MVEYPAFNRSTRVRFPVPLPNIYMPPPKGTINNPAGKRGPKTDAEKQVCKEKTQALRLARYLATPFDNLGMENRRRRVFEEQQYKCNRCGIDNWLGEVLSLELEHKDGNNKNDKRENLEGLCPNCHSLTPTWRGRNKKHRVLNSNG